MVDWQCMLEISYFRLSNIPIQTKQTQSVFCNELGVSTKELGSFHMVDQYD